MAESSVVQMPALARAYYEASFRDFLAAGDEARRNASGVRRGANLNSDAYAKYQRGPGWASVHRLSDRGAFKGGVGLIRPTPEQL
jgi:hypothetical protein